jgi:hypothetical protein
VRTLNPVVRGDDDMRGIVKGVNEKIDVLARRISRMPKIPDFAEWAPGSRTADGAFQQSVIGSTVSLRFNGWTIADNEGSEEAPTLSIDPDNENQILTAEEAWYVIRVTMRLEFHSSAPTVVGGEVDLSSAGNEPTWSEAVLASDGYVLAFDGCLVDHVSDPIFLTANSAIGPHFKWGTTDLATQSGAGCRVIVTKLG